MGIPKIVEKKNLMKELPLEVLGIIMNYTPRAQVYPILRGVNKEFYMLTAKRKAGLTFSKSEVTNRMFTQILEKSKCSVTSLTIKCKSLTFISPSALEKDLITLPKLKELDLIRFNNAINDTTLARLLNACTKSLTNFKIGWGCNTQSLGFGLQSTIALAKCKLLKRL